MATLPRSDKLAIYKKLTISMLSLLHRSQPMFPKIANSIFEENGLEKATQTLFNNISHYLVHLVDPQVHATLTWPLYDTRAEKTFRSELSRFISDYAAKGLLTDVPSSYLVHPSCFRISQLIHQLSALALKRLLVARIKGTEKQILFDEVTDKYNNRSDNKAFIEYMNNLEYENKLSLKLIGFLCKKEQNEKIAKMLREKITKCEDKLYMLNPLGYIDKLVDGFVSKHELDDKSRSEILKIKNINERAQFFDDRLKDLDKQLDVIEETWNNRVSPLLEKSRNMWQLSEEMIKRQTGQIDKSCYTLVYDPKNDAICTHELQNQVNTDQKYVLKNLVIDGRLNFPNLIRAYVISVCFILKNNTFGDEIYEFNNRIAAGVNDYEEVHLAMKALVQKVREAEKKIQHTPSYNDQSLTLEREDILIPPLPDLFGIKMNQNLYHMNFDTFTPLHFSKHRFNLHKREIVFSKPQPRSILGTYHAPRDDFLKTLMTSRASGYDQANLSRISNYSVISNIKANETIAECSSGFTKQQITRLLSTNKKSGSKRPKNQQERHNNVSFKKSGLFKDLSNDSHGLVRSYSSPNLLENRESKIPIANIRGRKLSIMLEDSPQDISGITSFENFNTPPSVNKFGNSKKARHSKISDETKNRLNNIQKELESAISPILEQETHFSNATARLQETHLPKPKTTLVIPKIITPAEKDSSFPKTDKVRELQEKQPFSTAKANVLSISPINMQESHSKIETPERNSTLIKKTMQETHSLNATKSNLLSESPVNMQESHSTIETSKTNSTLIKKKLQESHSFNTTKSPVNMQESHSKTETPKPNNSLIKKTSSLEKIINRFKQIRSTTVLNKDEGSIKTINEEKENFSTKDSGFHTNRNLLPDLLSPNVNSLNGRFNNVNYLDSMDFDMDEPVHHPRVSLGTMLGVDHTFLDQFDLID